MLKTRTRNVLISSDYSSQEVKLLAQLCEDDEMIELFRQGKDFYSDVASKAFKVDYIECLEFVPKGTPLKRLEKGYAIVKDSDTYDVLSDGTQQVVEGKKRRTQAKSILLGIMYGRSEDSIAEQLNISVLEAKDLKLAVYDALPKLQEYEQKLINDVVTKGYVSTLWGYKRRLPNYNLAEFDLTYLNGSKVPSVIANTHISRYKRIKRSDNVAISKFIKELQEKEYIIFKDNRSLKSAAKRQIVNSVIQGCLSGETLLNTKQFGKKPIKDFTNMFITLADGDDWSTGFVSYSGKKKKCILTLDNGVSIICSPTHLFLTTKGEWKALKDLSVNDEIEWKEM